MADLRFPLDGKELTSAEALQPAVRPRPRRSARRRPRRSAKVLERQQAALRAGHQHAGQGQGDRGQWRKFARPISSRNLANQVEDEVVDALVAAVQRRLSAALAPLLRAEGASWLGARPSSNYWDRNAPLPERRRHADRLDRGAASMVLDAYRALLARAGRRSARRFFDKRLDRRAAAAGQGAGRLRASDRAERASLSAAELPGQHARRDDAGARARATACTRCWRRRRASCWPTRR